MWSSGRQREEGSIAGLHAAGRIWSLGGLHQLTKLRPCTSSSPPSIPLCSCRRRDARLAAREHLRCSLEQVALQGTELRLRPITHLSGQPTLPPALRVAPGGELRCWAHAEVLGRKFWVPPSCPRSKLSCLLY